MPISELPSEQRQIVWDVLTQYWADTEYDGPQRDEFARRLASCGFTLDQLDRIAYWDVCGGFATYTLGAFATAGMGTPDFYFPEKEARSRILSWLNFPTVLSVCNPFWCLGYLTARWFLHRSWPDLRARVAKELNGRGGQVQ